VRCVFGLRLLLSFSLLSFSLYLSTLTFTLRLLTYDNISMKSCEYKFELSQQNQTVIFTFKTCTNCHSLYQTTEHKPTRTNSNRTTTTTLLSSSCPPSNSSREIRFSPNSRYTFKFIDSSTTIGRVY